MRGKRRERLSGILRRLSVLYGENGEVAGVRTGDKGLDKNGHRKANFEPGLLMKSKVTIFAEGSPGDHCSRRSQTN